jgi:hypothetical protein
VTTPEQHRVGSNIGPAGDIPRYSFRDGGSAHLPAFLARFLRPSDRVAFLSPGGAEILIERVSQQSRPLRLLAATIGHAGQPKECSTGAGFFVRTDLPNCSSGPTSLFVASDALRRYFYLLDGEKRETLYDLLDASELATSADLRMAWRFCNLELSAKSENARQRAQAERAFNILAHPDLRNCYDALRRSDDAPPLFPYGGFGSILVEGQLSDDRTAFFGHRVLAYKPEMTSRRVSFLLRNCEFFADRITCRDTRCKLEVWLDSNLLPSVSWDLTWNHWKYWLKTRIEVDATFVHAGKYSLKNGEWIFGTWHTALPSRLRVTIPDSLTADVERAKAIHTLLGENADVVRRVRAKVEKEPIEHTVIQDWFDRLCISPHLKPQHVTWRPDYEPYYFEQLRKQSRTWFLFRDEYLFVWPHVLISEVPQPGHATYVFAKPDTLNGFMDLYSRTNREGVRHNRNNVASELRFVGRVARGRRKKRWFTEVLKQAGENADYVDAFE